MIDAADLRFESQRERLRSNQDAEMKDLEDKLMGKLQRALDNPLADQENNMDEFKKFDVNGDGNIDKAEWDALEYEDRKRRLEDEDAQRDAQRKMTWFALSGMLLYPLAVVLADLLTLIEAAKILGSMASVYFVSVAGIVAAFFGASAFAKGK